MTLEMNVSLEVGSEKRFGSDYYDRNGQHIIAADAKYRVVAVRSVGFERWHIDFEQVEAPKRRKK